MHCCDLMDILLEDRRVPIKYSPIVREYSIILRQSAAIQVMTYCPWCGQAFLHSLRQTFHDILEKEYGLDRIDFDKAGQPIIPQEFKSDE